MALPDGEDRFGICRSICSGCRGPLYLGAPKGLAAVNCWSGLLDEVRIYSRALSADEIGGLARPCQTNPVPGDINCSDGVDFTDLAILASNWMRGPGRNTAASGPIPGVPAFSTRPRRRTWSIPAATTTSTPSSSRSARPATPTTTRPWNPAPPISPAAPSFDPLGYLIQLAHDTSGGKKYVEVHAWFVMQRIARPAR